MKRLVLLFALIALVFAASASANRPYWTLTLNATPGHLQQGETVTLDGFLAKNGYGVGGKLVTIYGYANPNCSGDPYGQADLVTDTGGDDEYEAGYYSLSGAVALIPGTYSFQSWFENHGSECVTLTVDEPPVTPEEAAAPVANGVWLCQGAFQTVAGEWDSVQAADLVANFGYTQAQAVEGLVYGGNNVGNYHLACNTHLKPTGFKTSNGGFVFGPDYGPALTGLGYYPIVK